MTKCSSIETLKVVTPLVKTAQDVMIKIYALVGSTDNLSKPCVCATDDVFYFAESRDT